MERHHNRTLFSLFVVKIKSREELELKLVKAACLRQKATTTSTLFNQAHAAHHRQFVTESRRKDSVSRLQKQMQSEMTKNNSQINKVTSYTKIL